MHYLQGVMRKMTVKDSTAFLKLPYIRENYKECIKEAIVEEMSYEDFLDNILKNEITLRTQNGITRKINKAGFPYKISLEDYKREHFSTEIKQEIRSLETMDFLDCGENVILIGNPGTGKTALAISLGMKACMDNKSVLFVSVPQLLLQIKEAMSKNQVLNYKRKFESYDLVILDELGYCTFDKERGEILFNILSSRSETKSLIITSNLTFDRWKEVFNDEILTGAIIDRLAYKSHLIDMSGESYRVKTTAEWKENNRNNGK